jgi:hypothetical protein
MWLLSLLSDMIIHTVTIIGVLGVIVAFFVPSNPFVAQYSIPAKILSVIILCIGIFFEGTIFKDKIWEARIAEAQQKVLKAEILAAEANSKIQYVYIIEKQEVEKKRQELQTRIRSESDKINMTCAVAPEAIDILNISAGAKK